MSVNFIDSFQENYEQINKLWNEWDLHTLREYRDMLFEKEWELVCTRVISSVKERAVISLQISDIHNLIALVARRINELMCEERYFDNLENNE